MKIYNTLSKQVEEFIPHDKNCVTMYTCGPTVYHYAHIGNLRCYIFEDILEKTLRYLGYSVKRCMNITDVGHLTSDSDSGEDKMLKGAKREKKSVLEIAEFYTKAFQKDVEQLNIKWPSIVSKATDNIDTYIQMIEKLLQKDFAYMSGGNVYFDTSKLSDYYKLTNHKIDDMVVGVRESVEEDQNKRNQSDFVLWFTKSKFDDQELKWDSPWGYGYPGWHIECSGISIKNLGEYLDIHCGGIDNIFPHHTNEIAQSEAYLGHPWCKYWVHSEHLNDKSGKMSKSKGEFLTLSLLKEKGYDPLVYRFLCLNSHYRKTLIFSYDTMDQTKRSFDKLLSKIESIQTGEMGQIDEKIVDLYQNKFKETLADDLNTASSLTVLYDLLKEDTSGATKIELIQKFDTVLSLNLLQKKEKEVESSFKEYILSKIKERKKAKENKDFALADSIRNELLEQGVVLKDTREGTLFEVRR